MSGYPDKTGSATPAQQRDACLVASFVLLLMWAIWHENIYIWLAMSVIFLGMTIPMVFRPVARLWFSLSLWLGKITSAILLAMVYVVILLPVAMARKLMGKDELNLKKWRKCSGSCFYARNHQYSGDDFYHPY